jgi:hypothetical protein
MYRGLPRAGRRGLGRQPGRVVSDWREAGGVPLARAGEMTAKPLPRMMAWPCGLRAGLLWHAKEADPVCVGSAS